MNWDFVKLSDCCISISDGDHQPPPKAKEGIPFVTISDITSYNQFNFENVMYVPDEYYESLDEKRKAKVGDVLYSVVGSYGIPILMKEPKKLVFQRHIAILRPNSNVESRYLYYTMKNPLFYAHADAVAIGAAQKTISLSSLRDLKIPIPPLSTQRRIADILSAYDDLIENNQRQIKLLEEAAMRLYREWFVFMRFPGHESVRIVDGVPEGWSEATIGDLAEYLNGFAFKPSDWKKDGFPIIKIKELTEGITSDTPRNSGESIPDKYLVKKGDIIFSWSATLFVKIWDAEDGLLNQHLFKVIPMQNVCREFVLQSIQGALPEFYNLTTGSTMVHIQRDKLDRVKRLIPDKKIMRLYEKTSTPIREKILYLTSQIYYLQKARDALLPRLMNGGVGLKLEGGTV